MAKLGTYTTFDCPEMNGQSNINLEAFAWLNKVVSEIDGKVRIIFNEHDFGTYPSFEIDYPHGLEDVDDEIFSEDDEYNSKLIESKDNFINAMNKIQSEYCDKFLSK